MQPAYRLVFTPEARDQISDIQRYIASVADRDTAWRFVDGLIDHIATLQTFPARGTPRDDLRTGLRTIAWRRRVTIAYVVEADAIVVAGVFYGGRDFETLLSGE